MKIGASKSSESFACYITDPGIIDLIQSPCHQERQQALARSRLRRDKIQCQP
jgi:hypothetical protein